MTEAVLEHVNVTVSNPDATAQRLCTLFDWKIRWQGASKLGGLTYHVGGESSYLAIYTSPKELSLQNNTYQIIGGLNHIGIVVDDLDLIEARVIEMGYKIHSHDDYEPGRRFYFKDEDKIEFEVISYS